MRWKPAVGTLLFVAALFVAGSEQLGPVWSIALLLIGVGAAWLLVPGFWRNVFYGALGGVVAGLLVLGPGLRLAMRVVAILDPTRRNEFTIGGTMFIIIGIGAIFGGIFGVFGNLARRGLGISLRGAGLVPALLVGLLIGLDSELRSEIIELGAGPWFNVPMFASVALGYGALWSAVVSRLETGSRRRNPRHEHAENATMAVSNPTGQQI